MFLEKISTLARDWNKDINHLEQVARESLLYGMLLIRTPYKLKAEFKRQGIDNSLVKTMWSGNAYLLITLPEVICDKRKKIPCLDDLLFARTVLTVEHVAQLEKRLLNRCPISRDELLKELQPHIKSKAPRARFLLQVDDKYENIDDIKIALNSIAIEIINREFHNFRMTDKDQIVQYLTYCFNRKFSTWVRKEAPKLFKARFEPDHFSTVVHESRTRCDGDDQTIDHVEFYEDLRGVVDQTTYEGLALFMGFADRELDKSFEIYLKGRATRRSWLTPTKLKSHIEKFLGEPIFDRVMQSQDLRKFLRARINLKDPSPLTAA